MKKFYSLSAAILLSLIFFNDGFAQYTATKTGVWSSNITWAPGAKPSAVCNNCTITISSNITVTLDAAVTLTGNSLLVIGANAKLIIPLSNNTAGGAHNTITLAIANPGPNIKLTTPSSSIDASASGQYDGVYSGFVIGGTGFPVFKLLGAPSSFFGFSLPALHGTALSGPASLNSLGTLPVVLVNFNAQLVDNTVAVTWTTEGEINSDHFNVQRSVDGVHFTNAGTVAAKGNSSVEVNYSFTDKSPLSSVNYYRLESVDIDGKSTLSEIKVVRGSLITGYSVFPNPARDFVNVTLSSAATAQLTLRIISQDGRVLQEKQVSNGAGTTISFPIRSLAQGAYLLQVKGADGTQQTSRFVVSHQ